jgi:hypothetical protein
MAAFNAELAAKALERRVQGLETQLEAVTKLGRAAGDSVAAVLELKKLATDQKQRIETLEKLVKALMETRGDSKQAALGKIEQTLRDLEIKQQKDRDEVFARMNQEDAKREKLGVGDVVRKQDVTKLIDEQMTQTYKSLGGVAEAESKRREVEAERKVQASLAEMRRQTEASIEQAMKTGQRLMQEAGERATKAMIDAQLSILSARLNAIEGKLSK